MNLNTACGMLVFLVAVLSAAIGPDNEKKEISRKLPNIASSEYFLGGGGGYSAEYGSFVRPRRRFSSLRRKSNDFWSDNSLNNWNPRQGSVLSSQRGGRLRHAGTQSECCTHETHAAILSCSGGGYVIWFVLLLLLLSRTPSHHTLQHTSHITRHTAGTDFLFVNNRQNRYRIRTVSRARRPRPRQRSFESDLTNVNFNWGNNGNNVNVGNVNSFWNQDFAADSFVVNNPSPAIPIPVQAVPRLPADLGLGLSNRYTNNPRPTGTNLDFGNVAGQGQGFEFGLGLGLGIIPVQAVPRRPADLGLGMPNQYINPRAPFSPIPGGFVPAGQGQGQQLGLGPRSPPPRSGGGRGPGFVPSLSGARLPLFCPAGLRSGPALSSRVPSFLRGF